MARKKGYKDLREQVHEKDLRGQIVELHATKNPRVLKGAAPPLTLEGEDFREWRRRSGPYHRALLQNAGVNVEDVELPKAG